MHQFQADKNKNILNADSSNAINIRYMHSQSAYSHTLISVLIKLGHDTRSSNRNMQLKKICAIATLIDRSRRSRAAGRTSMPDKSLQHFYLSDSQTIVNTKKRQTLSDCDPQTKKNNSQTRRELIDK